MKCRSFTGILLFLVLGIFSVPVGGQIRINEFSASNSSLIADPDFNNYADWIELYNSGTSDINLKAYYITDNFDNPSKWKFMDDAIIPAGGFLLVWADDRDTGLHTSYKLSADGEEIALYSPTHQLLDSLSFGLQKTDISYGRAGDGNPDWAYFLQPTPGNPNNTTAYDDICYNIPAFSITGGMYSGNVRVELKNDMGGEIRYTLDGSEPKNNSALYAGGILIDETTIVRARIFKPGQIPGPVITHSYFINENSAGGLLPVVSLATDPGNFWDPVRGIYVQDYKPLWEVPVNIELFENNGSDRAAFNLQAGVKINGLYSWQLPQKMLGIYFRDSYGSGSLDYPLLWQRPRNSYKSFALRASGSDWSYTLFRDILGQHATLENMDIDIMAFRPAVLYVNGYYMGIHNIREKVDDDYIEKSHHLEAGSFDMVENEDYAEAGSLDSYNDLLVLLKKDLSSDLNYNQVSNLVDIKNFTDFVITEMAVANTSIDHNVMAWKPKDYGKWKWVLMDLDRGFFNPWSNLISFYMGRDQLLLEELMPNDAYRDYFGRRLAAQLYTSFNPEKMRTLIDIHKKDIEAELPFHIERWTGTSSSYGNPIPNMKYWSDEVVKLKNFAEERPFALLKDLENYGFEGIISLGLGVSPEGGGKISIDGLKIPGQSAFGPYISGIGVNLLAEEIPGYEFEAWVNAEKTHLVPRGSVWYFLDDGSSQGQDWKETGFSTAGWKSGPAELGYGDGDENTTVLWVGDNRSKNITTYFRREFMLDKDQIDNGIFVISLLRDDGAVTYINGKEVLRNNMPYGEITFQTRSISSLGGNSEKIFIPYLIDREFFMEGINTIATEIHQYDGSSGDISFDLELAVYEADPGMVVSTRPEASIRLGNDSFLIARFREVSTCVVPEVIEGKFILGKDCSPWIAQGDIYVPDGSELLFEAGVELQMPEGASIYVEGELNAAGSPDDNISIYLNPAYGEASWGGIIYRNTRQPSRLSWLEVKDASHGPDPVNQNAAISAFHADLVIDHLTIENVFGNPVLARYSEIILTNSSLHSKVTGDLINVKYGKARIENCKFRGNDQPDTDAIDYDEIENGIIRNCIISDFLGYNSDAVDIGEEAVNVLIDSIFVFHVTDKGVSVGQRSTATIQNSIFINCNMGVALKDSCRVKINHCVFYGNVNAVASYEKNSGHAGGNGVVMNSVLSNSSPGPVFMDSKSSLSVAFSLSDNGDLQAGNSNLTGNPLFEAPAYFNFEVLPSSPVILAGWENGKAVDMGISFKALDFEPPLMINQFYVDANNSGQPEFIGLYNPLDRDLDISGYSVDKGITAILPAGTLIPAGEILYLTNDAGSSVWSHQHRQVLKWESGSLSNNGESLQLVDNYGIIIDYLVYQNDGLWPENGFSAEQVFQLKDPSLDNHLPENWTTISLGQVIDTLNIPEIQNLTVYPNPTGGLVTLKAPDYKNHFASFYRLNGSLLGKVLLDGNGMAALDISNWNEPVILVRVGDKVKKIILIK